MSLCGVNSNYRFIEKGYAKPKRASYKITYSLPFIFFKFNNLLSQYSTKVIPIEAYLTFKLSRTALVLSIIPYR